MADPVSTLAACYSPHRDVWHDRDDRQPYLLPAFPRIVQSLPESTPTGCLYEEIDASSGLIQGRLRRQPTIFKRLGLWRQRGRLVIHKRHPHGGDTTVDCVAAYAIRRRAMAGLGDGMAGCFRWRKHRCGFLHIAYHDFRRHCRRCRRGGDSGRGRRSRPIMKQWVLRKPRNCSWSDRTITGDIQPALSDGARLRGAGDGAVLQYQADLPAAGPFWKRPSTR